MMQKLLVSVLVFGTVGGGARGDGTPSAEEDCPECCVTQACCMSFVTRTRTARTVGHHRLCLSLKLQETGFDERRVNGGWQDLEGGDHHERFLVAVSAKYGWAPYHHIGISVPYLVNNVEEDESRLHNDGLGNIAVFEKWNVLPESRYLPAVAFDWWAFLGTGDDERKLGTTDTYHSVTAEVSKSWPLFSLHLNPGYSFRHGPDSWDVNGAVLVTPWKRVWLATEYNFRRFDEKGETHDVVPCVFWKFLPGACLKLGTVINVHSTTSYRDAMGLVMKLSYTF